MGGYTLQEPGQEHAKKIGLCFCPEKTLIRTEWLFYSDKKEREWESWETWNKDHVWNRMKIVDVILNDNRQAIIFITIIIIWS